MEVLPSAFKYCSVRVIAAGLHEKGANMEGHIAEPGCDQRHSNDCIVALAETAAAHAYVRIATQTSGPQKPLK
eukprot:2504046-Amphidinium_carterae.1